jgi:hypothetical protein
VPHAGLAHLARTTLALARYGLIAEEVAEVFPDLVADDGEGQPQGVLDYLLTGMLINELQKHEATIERQPARSAG